MVKHGVVVLPPAGMSLLDRLGEVLCPCCGGTRMHLSAWKVGRGLFLQSFFGMVGEVVVKFLEVALGCPEPKFPTTR